jgi:hypothetical protein
MVLARLTWGAQVSRYWRTLKNRHHVRAITITYFLAIGATGVYDCTMSDTAQGEGWWQAPDGKWYPPAPTQGPTTTQTAPHPPSPPQKKRFYKRWWFWLIIVLALGMGGCIGGIAAVSNQLTNSNHTVEYEVTGDGTASSITYANFNGNGSSGTAQESNVTLPWTKHLEGKGTLSVYSLVAQSGTATSISCKITIDGKEIVSKTSTGQFAVVDCSGSPPS